MTQPLFEHRQRFAGFDTRVLELEGAGAPLVLLHGFADSADTWRPVMALLGRHERRALAVDLPGFATADPLGAEPVLPQLESFARAVVEHAVDGSSEPAVVVGNSLGGCITLRLAQDHEAELAGVVPVAPAGLDMAAWFAIIERAPLLRTLLALPTPVPEQLVRSVVGQVYRQLAFSRPRLAAGEVVDAFTSHHRDRETVARYIATARRLLPELRDPFALERIDCPVLLVWGDRDRMVGHSGAQRVLDAVPNARLELFEGCGHCPQVEQAERLTKLLRDFPVRTTAAAA
ncbi:MAG TPA: alpha/beta fold hydrolase [Solirubrobacteraceae bacterium]|nr:alpha/beta fold hydrolase [Solirubrobacteraceae bacterium]